MAAKAHVISLATAVPAHVVRQSEVAERAREILALRDPDFLRLLPVFENAGIETRHVVRPVEWYGADLGWIDRTEVYIEAASALFLEAARKALDRAGLTGADIDTVVTVSSTGIATPSLEARVAAELGFRASVSRVPVFGLGCAGGVTGVSIAARLAEARPGRNVLVVAVELCSLAIRLDALSKANVVALALFGDGAAGMVLRAGDTGLLRIEAGFEHSWPDTLDIMGWSVDGQGFGVIFDRSIPPFATENLRAGLECQLDGSGIGIGDISRFVCHPGGAKVIEALETALDLPASTLQDERAILSQYGNMSAPTVLFVLEKALKSGLPARSAMMALGPGFTLSTVLLGSSS